jgi:hypothetical protein
LTRPNTLAPHPAAISGLLATALLLGTPAPAASSGGHDGHGHGHPGAPPSATSLGQAQADLRRARESLPPLPPGVTELALGELFGPIGDRGLEYSEKARALDGKPVRILGYMVSQDQPVPGTILLAPFPFQLHETEYGFAEDLPASLVHVLVPSQRDSAVPYTPGLLLLTGDLSIGPREEPDGRISTVRLTLHPRSGPPLHAAPTTKKENDR